MVAAGGGASIWNDAAPPGLARAGAARYDDVMTWDAEIDCEGLLCPLPVLKARKRLIGMEPGQVLRVRATDAMAAIDLPHFCAQAGHAFLSAAQEGGIGLYLIRRGVDRLDEEPDANG